MTKTKTATLWLAGIRTALTPENYQELATHLAAIAQECEVGEINAIHVALALERLSGNYHTSQVTGGNANEHRL